MASALPVEAPEGTIPRPKAPSSSCTSTSTVGLPRESRTWRARIWPICGMLDQCAPLEYLKYPFQSARRFAEDSFGGLSDPPLRFLVADVLDGRLAVDARQHQAPEMPHGHGLEI